jgi:hypothetical protein
MAGGGWLQWASYRDAERRVRDETHATLERMNGSLAPMVRAGDVEAIRQFLEFVRSILPVEGRIEVSDRFGARLAAVGVPPREGAGIYTPLSLPDEGMVGAVQVFLDEPGLRALARHSQRPGGTALFVGMMVAWIATEVFAALLVLSPLKKLHRALLRALRREGPIDVDLLQEELRTRGADEVDAILANTCEVIARSRREAIPELPRLAVVRDDEAPGRADKLPPAR